LATSSRTSLPNMQEVPADKLRYSVDVYVDDFIPMAIATSKEQQEHVTEAVMHGIHDVFPANTIDEEDPISYKKIMKGEGVWALEKDILGFTFDGEAGCHTMVLERPKREFLLTILHKWIRTAGRGGAPILFLEFESVISKLRYAFLAIPAGTGLLTTVKMLHYRRDQCC
jgi:hypothetical protein